jgi:hypothetical protein
MNPYMSAENGSKIKERKFYLEIDFNESFLTTPYFQNKYYFVIKKSIIVDKNFRVI